MQAMIRGELEVLKDWCYEAVSSFIQAALDSSFLCLLMSVTTNVCTKAFTWHAFFSQKYSFY